MREPVKCLVSYSVNLVQNDTKIVMLLVGRNKRQRIAPHGMVQCVPLIAPYELFFGSGFARVRVIQEQRIIPPVK